MAFTRDLETKYIYINKHGKTFAVILICLVILQICEKMLKVIFSYTGSFESDSLDSELYQENRESEVSLFSLQKYI